MRRREFFKTLGATSAVAMVPRLAFGADIQFKMHNKTGQQVLLDSLNNPNYWDGVNIERPKDQAWDEFKLAGFWLSDLCFGAWESNTQKSRWFKLFCTIRYLPAHMSGAKKMTTLQKVSTRTLAYRSLMVFFGDMDFFY